MAEGLAKGIGRSLGWAELPPNAPALGPESGYGVKDRDDLETHKFSPIQKLLVQREDLHLLPFVPSI